MRDYACKGYTVGKTINKPKDKPSIVKHENHILCYDVEREFNGKGEPTFGGQILSVGIQCSCGFKRLISICDVNGLDCP